MHIHGTFHNEKVFILIKGRHGSYHLEFANVLATKTIRNPPSCRFENKTGRCDTRLLGGPLLAPIWSM
jgi:hypothetical protein